MVKKFILPICILILIVCTACKFQHTIAPPEEDNFNKIRGWSILSDNEENALRVIEAANDYMINHLQLSHDIVWDLKDIKNEQKRGLVNKLINYAHDKGIPEVTVWDHALYSLDYYPDEFKTGPEGTINLDNEEFWEWLKEDYRIMLDLIPRVNGIILTFIETGARVEEQYSAHLLTPADKLAKVIDEIAEVVVNERKLKLYARTFIYTREERNNILNCIDKIKNEDVILMVKEVPHDFFLTHPVQLYVSRLKRPVLIEFDAGHEYSGQGIIANTFVEKTAERWRFYQHEPNVTGYVARTDRYGTTSIIDRPSEILLYVLYIMNMEPKISCEQIYNDFITLKYGKGALPHIKHAFENAYEIVTSSIYTLGLCMANHSTLSCDYQSIYNRFVSGRWMENPVVRIEHAVNKEFHYYKDVVNHLAPKHLKEPGARLFIEDPFIYDSSWVNPEELMNKEYLGYIVSEKDYGVRLSVEALQSIEKAEPFVTRSEFQDLYQTFYRTLVKARLSRGTAKAYFSYRIMSAYPSVNDSQLLDIFWEGIHEMNEMAEIIKHQFTDSPQGEWTWINELRV
ncbi:MAG: hypothetical protein IH591_09710, partial [Bacteroidales bacterium]|nr:hypothetical protein [Bacteroidales bacterium]